jgi:cytochrome c oxidase subunit 2
MTTGLTARTMRSALCLLAGTGALLMSGVATAEYGVDFQRPVTEIGRDLLWLHHLIFAICVIIFVGVFGVMFYSLAAHRKSRGHKAAKFEENGKLEVVWTIIPFFILVAMAIPSTATLLKMDDVTKSDLTVKITGHQWKWQYEYMDAGLSFFSLLSTPRAEIYNETEKNDNYLLEVDKPLVLPVGKKVRFLVTANDVLHAWWVPQFGVKKDAIPGFINETWTRIEEPGTYRGQCAELCGKDHGYMPIVVQAVNESEFKTWLAEQKKLMVAAAAAGDRTWSKQELMDRGKDVYNKVCAACHQPNGKGVPGVFPAIAGSKIANGAVEGHLGIVLNGKPGTAMQAFANQLNDADIAAVVTYERNALGNSVGDVVQPSQVKAARK